MYLLVLLDLRDDVFGKGSGDLNMIVVIGVGVGAVTRECRVRCNRVQGEIDRVGTIVRSEANVYRFVVADKCGDTKEQDLQRVISIDLDEYGRRDQFLASERSAEPHCLDCLPHFEGAPTVSRNEIRSYWGEAVRG